MAGRLIARWVSGTCVLSNITAASALFSKTRVTAPLRNTPKMLPAIRDPRAPNVKRRATGTGPLLREIALPQSVLYWIWFQLLFGGGSVEQACASTRRE